MGSGVGDAEADAVVAGGVDGPVVAIGVGLATDASGGVGDSDPVGPPVGPGVADADSDAGGPDGGVVMVGAGLTADAQATTTSPMTMAAT